MDKAQEDLLKEFYQLKEENKFLNEEKENLYRDRELAGELGKTLLQQNKELEDKIQEMHNEHHDIIMKMEVNCSCFEAQKLINREEKNGFKTAEIQFVIHVDLLPKHVLYMYICSTPHPSRV